MADPIHTPPRIAKLVARNRAVRHGHFPYEDRAWLLAQYEGGADFREIAARADCSLRTIARWMAIHQIPTRPNGHKRSPHKRYFCPCGVTVPRKVRWCPGCRAVAYRERSMGARNPNWRGVADVMVLLRGHVAAHWRPLVHTRDKHVCRRCGGVGANHAHHITSLSVLVQRKRIEWRPDLTTSEGRLDFVAKLCVDPDVMDVGNGLTLCEDCHRDTHRGGGGTAYAAVTGQRQVRRT